MFRPRKFSRTRGSSDSAARHQTGALHPRPTFSRGFVWPRACSSNLRALQEAQQQLEMGGQNPQAMINALQEQLTMCDAQSAEINEVLRQLNGANGNLIVNYHNLLVNEQNSIGYEQNRLNAMINNLRRQGGGLEQQRRELNAEVGRLRDLTKKAVDELKESIEKTQKKYVDAGKDTDITKALTDLSASTRFKQKLGASKDLQEAMNWLKRAQSDGPARGVRSKSGRRR